MTTPIRPNDFPQHAYEINPGASNDVANLRMTEAEARNAMRGEIVNTVNPAHSVWRTVMGGFESVTSMLDQLAAVITGGTPLKPALGNVQNALNDRFDLVQDISGYANAYMNENYKIYGNGPEALHVPFKGQSGPVKRAVIEADGSVTLEAGLWMAMAMVTIPKASWLTAKLGDMYLTGIDPNDPTGDTIVETKANFFTGDQKDHTAIVFGSFLCPEDNWKVEVRVWHNASSMRLQGGALHSRLTLFRLNQDTAGTLGATTVSTLDVELNSAPPSNP